MPHPNGSNGSPIQLPKTFSEIYEIVGENGVTFRSTREESMSARQGLAGDGVTTVLILEGERNVHGRVCAACWGFSISCTGERISQAISGLDALQSNA